MGVNDIVSVLTLPLLIYIAKVLTDIKVQLAVHDTEIKNLKSK